MTVDYRPTGGRHRALGVLAYHGLARVHGPTDRALGQVDPRPARHLVEIGAAVEAWRSGPDVVLRLTEAGWAMADIGEQLALALLDH